MKYVPAETLAFLIPLAPTLGTQIERWFVLIVATIGTLIYVLLRGDRRTFTVILAVFSLWAWIAGTTDFAQQLFGLPSASGRLVMAAAVFLIPAIDELVHRSKR